MRIAVTTGFCLLIFFSSFDDSKACTVGIVAGEASADGRPIAFKNRDFTFAYQGVSYKSNGTYKFIGIGNSGSSTTLMGMNNKGLALGNSVMSDLNGGGGNVSCMDWLLKNCTTVDECRTAIKNDTYSGSKPSFSLPIIGEEGKAYHVEKGSNYYEYDPLDFGSNNVRKYAVIVRTNNGHKNSNGTDDQNTGGQRYYEARDHMHNAVIKKGIFDNDPSDTAGVTISEVIQTLRWGNPGYEGGWEDATSRNCNSTSLSTMIAHGVNNNEDPKMAVMWSAIYKADYISFVPVWVEQGIRGALPSRIANGGNSNGLSYQAHRIYNKKDQNDYDKYVNSRFEVMETNFIQAVSNARKRWINNGFEYEEAKRISEESIETTYWTLKTMADQAQSNPRDLNETPLISKITADVSGISATLSHNATDSDGTIESTFWEFGDGQTSNEQNPSHDYASGGTYLVMCRVTDNDGSRNSIWKYVEVGGVAISASRIQAIGSSKIVSCITTGKSVSFTVQFNSSGRFTLNIFNVKGQRIWTYSDVKSNEGFFRIAWDYSNSTNWFSNTTYIATLEHQGNQSVRKFVIMK